MKGDDETPAEGGREGGREDKEMEEMEGGEEGKRKKGIVVVGDGRREE